MIGEVGILERTGILSHEISLLVVLIDSRSRRDIVIILIYGYALTALDLYNFLKFIFLSNMLCISRISQQCQQNTEKKLLHTLKFVSKNTHYLVPIQIKNIPSRISARSRAFARRFLSLNMIAPHMNEMMTELRRTSDTTEIMESC